MLKLTARIFIVASRTIRFGVGPEKFRLSLPPVPARNHFIVRDVRIFINSRSRVGASPWHFLERGKGRANFLIGRFLMSDAATQSPRENRFTLLATRFHLVQSRSHRIYVKSLVSIELR